MIALEGRARVLTAALALAAAASGARADAPSTGDAPAATEPRATGDELSLRIQSYRPAIDSEFGGADKPFALAFGSGRTWGGRLEYAKTLSTGLGTFGLGLGIGYLGASGHGLYRDGTTSS